MIGVRCIRSGCPDSGRECELWNECPLFLADRSAWKETKIKRSEANPTEEGEQGVVREFCELSKIPLVHIPNEGKRSKATGARLKAMGMQKGFPDLFIPEPKGKYHGLFIEMKRDREQKPTKEQAAWISLLNGKGYFAVVCYGAEDAIDTIRAYMKIKTKKERS